MVDLDPETEIEALIETYAGGFDDHDAEAVTACFAYPAVIWQFGTGHVFADAEEMAENAAALLKVHEEAGIVLSSFEIVDLTVSGVSALATVEWEQEDDEGVVLMDFTCHYHLVRLGDRWRIASVVNVEEEDEED